jgi:hypothetical protein
VSHAQGVQGGESIRSRERLLEGGLGMDDGAPALPAVEGSLRVRDATRAPHELDRRGARVRGRARRVAAGRREARERAERAAGPEQPARQAKRARAAPTGAASCDYERTCGGAKGSARGGLSESACGGLSESARGGLSEKIAHRHLLTPAPPR